VILILEDGDDLEALLGGDEAILTPRRMHTIWTSPEAYAKDVVIADLRRKLLALPVIADGHRNFVFVSEILDLMDMEGQ